MSIHPPPLPGSRSAGDPVKEALRYGGFFFGGAAASAAFILLSTVPFRSLHIANTSRPNVLTLVLLGFSVIALVVEVLILFDPRTSPAE